ncbi:MAG: hypothetical protein DRJ52_10870 [Thermoprotei archaeon]|nr:MAG: hypothetical protein DRJ52_10870 [Thermoprotei archaeon]
MEELKDAVVVFQALLKAKKNVFRQRDLSSNPVYAKKILSILEKYGLAEVYRSKRSVLVVLTSRGEEALNLASKFCEIVFGEKFPVESSRIESHDKRFEVHMPEYLKDNPWISVLAKRGKS